MRWLKQLGLYTAFTPPVGQVQFGDLNRTTPFSTEFGYDRGGPVDRYYIESFLQKQAGNIKGRVLEIGDNEYTLRFGGQQVTKSDVLHIHSNNPIATIVGDLSNAPHIPDNSFDCIVLTQTLHLIYKAQDALKTCERILKPGGILLLTSPGISQIASDEWQSTWFWSFTATSMRRMLGEVFPPANIEIEQYGNVFVATSFLYGVGVSEVSKEQLAAKDPNYPVIITAKVIKPSIS
ncbi:methyltransferase domain-containing protein [Spirosoma fluviale]|uniref:Methyltransferase domain-containing protein n=1 Tax=Spirosoma fluviale TaxID=1597977 RepID=A0A286FI86_9BACT|nr:methyltransferase domain-containing protein [Spirosoma fluviale]SOD82977.1 Methyltransferase domain-containing protein [Spirosoma fluviale]